MRYGNFLKLAKPEKQGKHNTAIIYAIVINK